MTGPVVAAIVAHVSLTTREREVLREVAHWSRLGAWSASARFDQAAVRALKLRGLVRGETKLHVTREGRELVAAGI